MRELLLETEMSLSEISEALGIEHPEYLSVFFKEETGLTPKEYRDQVRGRRYARSRTDDASACGKISQNSRVNAHVQGG